MEYTEKLKITKLPLIEFYRNKLCNNEKVLDLDLNKKRCEYVYLFGNVQTRMFKIGRTNNIGDRIRRIRTQSGCIIVDFLWIELSEKDEPSSFIEKSLHEFFKTKRHNGRLTEWFTLDIKDIIQIRRLFRMIEGEEVYDVLNKCDMSDRVFDFLSGKEFSFSSYYKI
jgi:hypothetical protein